MNLTAKNLPLTTLSSTKKIFRSFAFIKPVVLDRAMQLAPALFLDDTIRQIDRHFVWIEIRICMEISFLSPFSSSSSLWIASFAKSHEDDEKTNNEEKTF